MSSPMMTRMFGFGRCCCADAGVISTHASDASRARQILLGGFMSVPPLEMSNADAPVGPSACACQLTLRSLIAGVGGVCSLNHLDDLTQVVRLRRLQRWKFLI